MAITNRRSLPIPTAAEQADRVLSPERKRELTIDTRASWALEGMEPTREIVENNNAFQPAGSRRVNTSGS